MTFDNTPTQRPTTQAKLKEHFPIAILVAGVGALAFGIHLAAVTVLIAALAHLAVGGFLLWFRRRNLESTQGQR